MNKTINNMLRLDLENWLKRTYLIKKWEISQKGGIPLRKGKTVHPEIIFESKLKILTCLFLIWLI